MASVNQSRRIGALAPEQRALLIQRLAERGRDERPRLARTLRTPEGNQLSRAQRRFWVLDRLYQGSGAYNVPLGVRLCEVLDREATVGALAALVQRHEVLRTAIVPHGRDLRQQVRAACSVPLRIADVRDLAKERQLEEASRIEAAEIARPFDLSEPPALRAVVVLTSAAGVRLHLVTHHALSDAQSLTLLMRDFFTAYDAILRGSDVAMVLPPQPLQYIDFAEWEGQRRSALPVDIGLEYWRERLSGAPALLSVPADHPRPSRRNHVGGRVVSQLSEEVARAVDSCGRVHQTTAFMTLLSAFQVLLHRLSGETDIMVGCPISERESPDLDSMVGCFINTVVVRVDLSGDPTFGDFLGRVRKAVLGAQAHRDVPFEDVVRALRPERASGHTSLFQVGFGLVASPLPTDAGVPASVELLPTHNGCSKFDLTLEVVRTGATFDLLLEYDAELFERSTATRLLAHFSTLLQSLVCASANRISRAPLLEQPERSQVLEMGRGESLVVPPTPGAHVLFERWAVERPDAPALINGQASETYASLSAAANRLANYLRSLGVERGDLVGICLGDASHTICSVLAILKAGAAFVPLDPTYPVERLRYMVDDCRPRAIICDSETEGLVAGRGSQIVNIATAVSAIARQSEHAVTVLTTAGDRAYVIYTSGSTGRPKGVVLDHGGLINLAHAQRFLFRVEPRDRVLQFSSFSFDASVWELSMALFSGAALCPVDRMALTRNPSLLAEFLRVESISIATLPPSMLSALRRSDLPSLRVLISAGERCSKELVERWAAGREFYNAYGPTETTVCATVKRCVVEDSDQPSIGRPLPNLYVRILDAHGESVPVGVPGNIHVGGIALARGYLNQTELSSEAFIRDPFGAPNDRLYRTGDRGAFRPDGDIVFLGRSDDQVKIRGHRIEPAEVEEAFRKIRGIREVVVEPWPPSGGAQRLVAFIVPENGGEPSTPEILRQLRERLPIYMVPSNIVRLERLPQTPNGKVDRRALPAPGASGPEAGAGALADQGLERQIAAVWKRVLRLDSVGANDNFFDIGGDSLLLIEVQCELEATLGREVNPVALFEHPTISALGAALSSVARRGSVPEQEDQVNRAERRRASLNSMAQRHSERSSQ